MNYFAPVANTQVWTELPSFYISLLILVLVPFGMLSWIRRRGWM